MSTTTTTTSESGVNLTPASTLETLLGGQETYQVNQRKIDELEAERQKLIDKYGPSGIGSKGRKLTREIEKLRANPSPVRSGGLLDEGVRQLAQMGKNMPGQEYAAGKTASNELAQMFAEYSKTGGLPGQQDISQASGLAQNLFAARRAALQQELADQSTAFQQEMGRRGIYGSDPVANAKLRTGFMKQKDLLSAEQMAESTRIAMGLPGQRLQYKAGQTDVLTSVADRETQRYQQGLANLTSLLGVGSGLLSQEQSFRLATSPKIQKNTQETGGFGTVVSGIAGGIGAIGGVLGGIGAMNQGTAFQRLSQGSSQSLGFGANLPGIPQNTFGGYSPSLQYPPSGYGFTR